MGAVLLVHHEKLGAAYALKVIADVTLDADALVVGDLDTKEGRAVLCDFGLATQAGASLTKTGEVLGTPAYLAPEQALGDKEKLGPHTDVFGLAAVLYFALTRERAFGRLST